MRRGITVAALSLALSFAAAPAEPVVGQVPAPAPSAGAECVDRDMDATAEMLVADAALRDAERRQVGSPTRSGVRDRSISPVVTVRVYVHVLRTKNRGGVSGPRIKHQIKVWNAAYAGAQNRNAAVASFRFHVVGRDVTVNPRWYRLDKGSLAERHAKATLHRGGARDVNVYIGSNRAGILGWSTQPSAYAAHPAMDGIVMARRSLPGGRGGHYSDGDALVHESGHWLGLFHTFSGGCTSRGDLVGDTPAEVRPSYTCPERRDTCTAPGRDPVHNFMDYSYDSCVDRFTVGQAARMTRNWDAFRSGGQP